MNWLEFISTMVSALAWPVVAAALVIWLVKGARSAGLLSDLRARIQSVKAGPGGVEASFFEYGKSPVDIVTPGQPQRAAPSRAGPMPPLAAARLDRFGNLYWLGHDLGWTIDVVLRGGNKSIVLHGLRQSLHHLQAVGLSDSAPGVWLDTMLGSLGSQTDEFVPIQRTQVAENLRAIIDMIGEQVTAHQPDFDPGLRTLPGSDS